MTHRVNIRIPTNVQPDQISGDNWFKQTSKLADGSKSTVLFQRNEPRSLGQKIMDFFSGVKKAKDSVTLSEAFKCITKDTSMGGKFNVNLIPTAIRQLQPKAPEDLLDTSTQAAPLKYGNYQVRLEDS